MIREKVSLLHSSLFTGASDQISRMNKRAARVTVTTIPQQFDFTMLDYFRSILSINSNNCSVKL